jgi:hypothetical protein
MYFFQSLLTLYNVHLRYVSPANLGMPNEVMDYIGSKGIPQTNFSSLEDALPETDVLYMTRIQRERFATQQEYDMVRYHKNIFCLYVLFILISYQFSGLRSFCCHATFDAIGKTPYGCHASAT